MTSEVKAAVAATIRKWNWFEEQDTRLVELAEQGKAEEIRDWADEVEGAPDCHHAKGECDHAWPAWFCAEVADSMRDVAELIEASSYLVGDDAGSGPEGGTLIQAESPDEALDWIQRWVAENNDADYRPTLWARRMSDERFFEREFDASL